MHFFGAIILSLAISFQAHASWFSSEHNDVKPISHISHIDREQKESITLVIDYDTKEQYVIETIKTKYNKMFTTRYNVNPIEDLSVLFQGDNGFNPDVAREDVSFDIYLQGDFHLSIFDKIDLFVFKVNGVEFKSHKENLVTKTNGRYGLIKIGDTERINYDYSELIFIQNNRNLLQFNFAVHKAVKISNHLVQSIVDSKIPTQAQFKGAYHSIDMKVLNEKEEYVFVAEKPTEFIRNISYAYENNIAFNNIQNMKMNVFIGKEYEKDNSIQITNYNKYLKNVILRMDGFLFSHNYSHITQVSLMQGRTTRLDFF